MNESGIGVIDFLNFFKIEPEEILVVMDDFALDFGTLRIRKSGSDGGHNGLWSVIRSCGTENIPRMRIGVGPLPENDSSVDFVLSNFTEQQLIALDSILEKAEEALFSSITEGLDTTMSIYNKQYE